MISNADEPSKIDFLSGDINNCRLRKYAMTTEHIPVIVASPIPKLNKPNFLRNVKPATEFVKFCGG